MMPENYTEVDSRLWDNGDELRANSQLNRKFLSLSFYLIYDPWKGGR